MTTGQLIMQGNIPAGYDRVQVVDSFQAWLGAKFNERVNVIALARPHETSSFENLAASIGEHLDAHEPNRGWILTARDIASFTGTQQARNFVEPLQKIKRDVKFLSSNGYNNVVLRLVKKYGSTDVLERAHSAGADIRLGRVITCYNGPGTEFFRNEDVTVSILSNIVSVNVASHAIPFSFPNGTIWKQAGKEQLPPISVRRLANAAFHRGVPSETYSLRLIADRVSGGRSASYDVSCFDV